MPIVRSLLFYAARRIASDPAVRAKAAGVTRDHVLPAARGAARRTGETVRRQSEALRADIDFVEITAAPETPRTEKAGRIARRVLARMREPED